MELTKEQLLQIDNYVFSCGIKYYDVRTEIVDHFANILEKKLAKNPDINFKKEIINIHRNFSDRGFSNLLKDKTRAVQKKFYNATLKHLITFFKLPRILISATIFYVLFLLMNFFDDKKQFFEIFSLGALLSCFIFLILFFYRNKKKTKFLALERSNNFNLFIMQLFQLFCYSVDFRTDESFLNLVHNNIQLAVFVLIILFYWSGEFVYKKNKQLVKTQYPNIIV
ncbi:hypothetical protein [uncultured Polaribacter sp.]|uniref:hypothetical protein n=1 Tax=uncultured Polaribacter sp. TaxID=174711 RepID=UPI00260AE90F|nr:hypothetical protein [uncultured Polaribacter sp.]